MLWALHTKAIKLVIPKLHLKRDWGKIIITSHLTSVTLPLLCLQVGKINLLSAQRREQHILTMVLSMVSCFILCWMPYGIMALMATFGRSGLVTPVASTVPSVLAKFSTVVNPIIYIFFNNQVRSSSNTHCLYLMYSLLELCDTSSVESKYIE